MLTRTKKKNDCSLIGFFLLTQKRPSISPFDQSGRKGVGGLAGGAMVDPKDAELFSQGQQTTMVIVWLGLMVLFPILLIYVVIISYATILVTFM